MDAADDPIVTEHRAQITACDLDILAAVNRRIELVSSLHRHKHAQGYPTLDPGRERLLIERLEEANSGPLSDEPLRRLYALLLELCTSEAARMNNEQASA